MNAEAPTALNFLVPLALDTDSHGHPNIYGFISDTKNPETAHQFRKLILIWGNKYTLLYPEKTFPTSLIRKVEGIFEHKNGKTLFQEATVWFPDNSKQSGATCDVAILEGMQVIDETMNKTITVGFSGESYSFKR